MGLAQEKDINLAYDTVSLRHYGAQYGKIAAEMRQMAKDLNRCLADLKESGWTTPAGTAFHKMTECNWEDNIKMYADLLDTLQEAIEYACKTYDSLSRNHIEKTKL